jgi:hypothetical protein
MRVNSLSRIVLMVTMGVVSMGGSILQAGVQGRGNPHENEKEKEHPSPAAQPQEKSHQPTSRLPPPQQQLRVTEQQERGYQYGQYLGQQRTFAQQRSVKLQQQHRTNQYQFQLLYMDRLNQQQLVIQNSRGYDYGGDPYFYTASIYRYSRGNRFYETNQYGADLLRHAVNNGYDEGVRSGIADRRDRWVFNYRDSFAYQDANFGYAGYYVDRDDYNFYFREGFRRGYEDGFYSRNQYGHYSNGSYAVPGATLSVILDLRPIR